MPEFLRSLRQYYSSQLKRYRNRPFLRAAMAACALVSTASGSVSFRQRVRLDLVMETLDALKVFDPHEGVELFNGFADVLKTDSKEGHRLTRQVVSSEVALDPEKARLLVRVCLAVSERDGAIPAPEQDEIAALCRWIGVSPDVCGESTAFARYRTPDGDGRRTMLIGNLMVESGVQFGTSGARGLAADMTDRVCYAYTLGFMQHLAGSGALATGGEVAIAGDLRPSTGRILAACARAAADLGYRPRHFGRIPSPALAAFGIAQGIPSMMVTGSHIPDDRNGIKFNLPTGEILKEDEAAIRGQTVSLPDGLFEPDGSFTAGTPSALPEAETTAFDAYVARYLDFFPTDSLAGLRVGLYEHSSVASDAYFAVLTGLGARVDRLGFSEVFIPVDTEAIRPEDVQLARDWAADGGYDALVSADGDGDRPLISDEKGEWLRGDIAGILCARQLGAAGVATPVSCNTAVEKCGWFSAIKRTRIGSPFVIEGMQELVDRGVQPVVGYEANGGFLLASDIELEDECLSALPTRDAVLVAVTILLAATKQGKPVSALTMDLPQRFTASDRIKEFPTELSRARLAPMSSGDFERDRAAVEAMFGATFGQVTAIDVTDGVRVTFANGEIAHLRPSGNAPELRAYTESDTPDRAQEMNRMCMDILAGWRNA